MILLSIKYWMDEHRPNAIASRHREFSNSSTINLVNDSQSTNLGETRTKHYCARFADLFLLNMFLFTPLTIFYWAATWDIIYLYIFPNNFALSFLATFLFANAILICVYVFQYDFQLIHNYLHGCAAHDGLLINEAASPKAAAARLKSYYDKAFLFRFLYSYLVANAYVAQWRTYWDVFNRMTENVHYLYFVAISIIAFVLYRCVLQNSLESYSKTVPYCLMRDIHLDTYFIQWQKVYLNSVTICLPFNLLFELKK